VPHEAARAAGACARSRCSSTRLRPALLARYSAASARDTSCSTVSSRRKQATPADTVRPAPGVSALQSCAATACRMRCTARSATEQSVGSVISRMNSSPPKRANTSDTRRLPPATRQNSLSTWSPTGCPNRSFTVLKWSMSNTATQKGMPLRCARAASADSCAMKLRRFSTPVRSSWLASCSMRSSDSRSCWFFCDSLARSVLNCRPIAVSGCMHSTKKRPQDRGFGARGAGVGHAVARNVQRPGCGRRLQQPRDGVLAAVERDHREVVADQQAHEEDDRQLGRDHHERHLHHPAGTHLRGQHARVAQAKVPAAAYHQPEAGAVAHACQRERHSHPPGHRAGHRVQREHPRLQREVHHADAGHAQAVALQLLQCRGVGGACITARAPRAQGRGWWPVRSHRGPAPPSSKA